jgi:hypothetical protein
MAGWADMERLSLYKALLTSHPDRTSQIGLRSRRHRTQPHSITTLETPLHHISKLVQNGQMPVQLAATLAEIEEGFAHEGAVQCQQTGLVGEETLTRFDSKMWFAVRTGDLLCDRYKVLGKVANGGSSTIWFVQDTL